MKLNPPASSSDLEAARAIARRLHRRALGHERATDLPPEVSESWAVPLPPVEAVSPAAPPEPTRPPALEPAASLPTLGVEPPVPGPEPFEPEPVAAAAPPEPPEPEAAAPEPAADSPAPEPPADAFLDTALPAPPVTGDAPDDTTAPEAVETFEEELEGPDFGESLDEAVAVPESPSLEALASEAPEIGGPEEPSLPESWDAQATPAEGVLAPPAIDPESALGDLAAGDEGAAVLEGLEPPAEAGSPEDLLGDAAPGWPESSPLEGPAETEPEPERAPDDLVEPPTPSWDDVTDSCRALARAHAAMVVAPSGQVLAARGDWPEPGPEAIGGRLVSMMEKTLQDAPTRSVSAPLAGRHLTAWRVPANEGYYTLVFMGDAPLGADIRSPVDVEVKQALGP